MHGSTSSSSGFFVQRLPAVKQPLQAGASDQFASGLGDTAIRCLADPVEQRLRFDLGQRVAALHGRVGESAKSLRGRVLVARLRRTQGQQHLERAADRPVLA